MVGRKILASPVLPVAGFLLALLLASCVAPPENSLHRAEREREYRAWLFRRDLLQKETERLQAFVTEGDKKAQQLRDEAAMTASRTRDEMARLDYEVGLLHHAEADLKATRERLLAVEQEKQPVLAAIAALELKEKQLAELQAKAQAVEQGIATAQQALQQQQVAAQARLSELQQQQQAVAAFDAAVQQAMAAVKAAATPLVPPPPPPAEPKPPATPPPQQPPKK
jgi:hypothetical protein